MTIERWKKPRISNRLLRANLPYLISLLAVAIIDPAWCGAIFIVTVRQTRNHKTFWASRKTRGSKRKTPRDLSMEIAFSVCVRAEECVRGPTHLLWRIVRPVQTSWARSYQMIALSTRWYHEVVKFALKYLRLLCKPMMQSSANNSSKLFSAIEEKTALFAALMQQIVHQRWPQRLFKQKWMILWSY